MKYLQMNSSEDVYLTEHFGPNTQFKNTMDKNGYYLFEIVFENKTSIKGISKTKRESILNAIKKLEIE